MRKRITEAVKGLNEYTGANRMFALFAPKRRRTRRVQRQTKGSLVRRNAVPFVRAGRGKNGKVLIPKAALLEYLRGGSTG